MDSIPLVGFEGLSKEIQIVTTIQTNFILAVKMNLHLMDRDAEHQTLSRGW